MVNTTALKKELNKGELGSFYKTVGGAEGDKCFYPTRLDTSVRLAPCLHNTVDFKKINDITCDKILVEFLRVNANTKRELNNIINIDEFTVTEGGCQHLPLNKKLDIINKLDYKEVSVCDDVQAHYDYFLENVCHNPNDCCNLTL